MCDSTVYPHCFIDNPHYHISRPIDQRITQWIVCDWFGPIADRKLVLIYKVVDINLIICRKQCQQFDNMFWRLNINKYEERTSDALFYGQIKRGNFSLTWNVGESYILSSYENDFYSGIHKIIFTLVCSQCILCSISLIFLRTNVVHFLSLECWRILYVKFLNMKTIFTLKLTKLLWNVVGTFFV
jgi:hypothetical protein